ncbi:carbohydrate diacid regulator [Atopostipes suicloacalis DSM 15692]|uniref:Carbohydrate diacid regulator n=1 Tax=Atopostipes suicloacalis DSM 15692 TaxID=1121025 RepID=A0A1M4YB52_9LACT|nr:sugar diacid recognition domain-containing protein [Atopostipes suicloacalis]SHF03024.1 carbohydrate diacid regulator [Atopostipes suicloacalis DSM 15692]
MIAVEVAQNIVDSMKAIIHQEINYFSIKGEIIASTDPTRIGENHDGAKLVIETEKSLIISYDEEFKGAKQGINLPVLLNQNIVGVIGITGKKDEVSKYGEIIKQMTEILIRDSIAKDIIFNKRHSHRFIIDYIMERNIALEQSPGLIKFLYDTNFDLTRVVITGVLINNNDLTYEMTSKIYNELNTLIGLNENNIFDVRNGFITILIEIHSSENINTIIENILSRLKSNLDSNFIFGIGSLATSIDTLKNSIKNSYTALSWNLNFHSLPYLYYNEMEYGIILHDILKEDKEFFLDNIFKDVTPEEIGEIIDLLNIYEEHNGSIKKCADELFVHKNTVQYQLNKINNLTGYNPRNLKDFFILKLACILYQTT